MNSSAENLAEDLLLFINHSPTAFHCVLESEERLKSKGFVKLDERQRWKLRKGGRYYVGRNSSSLVAFILGQRDVWESGFKIAGAHTDSPCLKIKNQGASVVGGLLRMSVEPYGGGIYATWLDRNLSIAGRIAVENDKGDMKSVFVNFVDPVAIIPNQAIHMNRDLNKGFEYNKQNHLQVILADVDQASEEKPADLFKKLIADRAGIDVNTILDMELFLYDVQPGIINGMNREFISSSRLDNLTMCHAIIDSMVYSDELCTQSSMAVLFDNEEIGSKTMQGADSSFLRDLIDRITLVTGGSAEETFLSKARSFSISADGAHAHHPNFPESHDPLYAPVINGGPVIKISSNYKYSTTSETSSVFRKLCKDARIPYQELINKSDVPSGSTIGTISSALTGIRSVDVGSPMFAMHSIRETGGVLDHFYMSEVLKRFFKYDVNCQ